MKPVSILSLATSTPGHDLPQSEAVAATRDLIGGQFADFDRLASVFTNAGIEHRQLAMPVEWYRRPRSFQERAEVYLEVAVDLFVKVASRALDEAGVRAEDVDTIVTVSSTGIATPSLPSGGSAGSATATPCRATFRDLPAEPAPSRSPRTDRYLDRGSLWRNW